MKAEEQPPLSLSLIHILFNHPVFLGLSFLCSFAYAAKLRGRRAAWFGLALAPCILLFASTVTPKWVYPA